MYFHIDTIYDQRELYIGKWFMDIEETIWYKTHNRNFKGHA